MKLNPYNERKCVVIEIIGSIDAITYEQLINTISVLNSSGSSQIILDFSQVEFLSSAGLRALLISLKECRGSGGDLRIAEITNRVCKVLDLEGFTSILKLYGTVNEAIESFN